MTLKKLLVSATLLLMAVMPMQAQNYQDAIDTMYATYRYEQIGDEYTKMVDTKGVMNGWTSSDSKMVYYWRMPAGHTRADMVYQPRYLRMPRFGVKVERVMTGEVLYEAEIQTTVYKSEVTTIELIPDIVIPADEYYRVELSIDNSATIKYLYYFLFQRESTDPVIMSPNLGGTGSHLFSWGTTDADAPSGNAYDWAYLEAMVPYEYQHPCDYFMTIGALNSYMGMQTVGRVNGDDFNRSVLFSVWDNGNTDEDPDLPSYMRSQVFDYNHEAVSGHGGGEGSSGTVMFKNKVSYWRPDHWVQFLLNVRPERVTITMEDSQGQDSVGTAENTIMTAWFKMDTDTVWTYMASIRASFLNQLISGWYSFIENFGGIEGWSKHRVNYRHGFLRSASSGKWYNRNYVVYYPDSDDRTTRVDLGHGAASKIDNAFYLEYGGYKLQADSSHYTNLLADHTCVDTINLDRLNDRVDQALKLANRYVVNTALNTCATTYDKSKWQIVSYTGQTASYMLDYSTSTCWNSTTLPHEVVLKADEELTITSFTLGYQDGYGSHCREVDVYYSADGTEWTLGADSIYIYNERSTEVTLPVPLTAQYFKLVLYDNIDGSTLKVNDLTFKGPYDETLLAEKAEELLASENCLEGYTTADLQNLREVYNNGDYADANTLATAIKDLALNAMPLKYGRAAAKNNISSSSAYMLKNGSGYGYLCADTDGRLVLKDATTDGALEAYTDTATATNPYNSWRIIVSEDYDYIYVYNIGAGKYLSLAEIPYLSDEPYAIAVYFTTNQIAFGQSDKNSDQYGKYLSCDPTSTECVSLSTTNTMRCRLEVLNNYYLRPGTQESLELIDELFASEPLEAYAEKARALIAVPEGLVGSMTDAAEIENLQSLYNGGNPDLDDLDALIEAVDNATVLSVDDAHTYRVINTMSDNSSPCLTTTSTKLAMAELSNKEPAQMWRIQTNGTGYVLTAQNQGIDQQPFDYGSRVGTTTADNAFTYHLATQTAGEYYLAQSDFQPQTLCGRGSMVLTGELTDEDSQWQIEPVSEYSLTLNSAGNALMCVDFDVVLPDEVTAYAANHVTGDGVIKLSQIEGIVPAMTPVLLKGTGYATVTFEVLGHQTPSYDGGNLFVGTMFAKTGMAKRTYYALKTSNGTSVMKLGLVSSNISENQAYILAEDALPSLDTYTFDFDDLVSSIDDMALPAADTGTAETKTYDLQGRPSEAETSGIYIQDHKKVLK